MGKNLSEAQQQFISMLHKHAIKQETSPELLQELIAFEQKKAHLERRRGVKKDLQKMIEDSLEGQE